MLYNAAASMSVNMLAKTLNRLDIKTRESLINEMMNALCQEHGFKNADTEMATSSLKTMQTLQRENITPYLVDKFRQIINTKREGSEESMMPLNRMPFGMVQYQIEFFAADHIKQVFV